MGKLEHNNARFGFAGWRHGHSCRVIGGGIVGKKIKILDEVFSSAEAAERWRMDRTSVRQLCTGVQGRPPRLVVGEECKKSGGVWLVTRAGMERLYGKESK